MKGAILNVNGIIINNDQYEFAAWQQVAMYEYGMGLPGKLAPEFAGLSKKAALQKVLTHFKQDASAVDQAALLAKQDEFYGLALEKLDESALIPGIDRLIVNLYDHYVDLAINDEDGHAAAVIKQTKLDGYVNLVAQPTSGTNPYVDLAQQLGVQPADSIALGTTATAIDQMKVAGVTAIGIGDEAVLQAADYRVTQVGDLRYQMLEKVWEDNNQ